MADETKGDQSTVDRPKEEREMPRKRGAE